MSNNRIGKKIKETSSPNTSRTLTQNLRIWNLIYGLRIKNSYIDKLIFMNTVFYAGCHSKTYLQFFMYTRAVFTIYTWLLIYKYQRIIFVWKICNTVYITLLMCGLFNMTQYRYINFWMNIFYSVSSIFYYPHYQSLTPHDRQYIFTIYYKLKRL